MLKQKNRVTHKKIVFSLGIFYLSRGRLIFYLMRSASSFFHENRLAIFKRLPTPGIMLNIYINEFIETKLYLKLLHHK